MRNGDVFLFIIFFSAVLGDRYDELCDEIVVHAQRAAVERNRRNEARAGKHTAAALQSFKAAVKVNDKEPQAYVNYAQFLFNINRPQDSLQYWEGARKRARPSDKGQADTGQDVDVISWIDSRIALAKYAHASMQRDKAYALGQGNISEAIGWAEQQVAIYGSPFVMFEMATMEVMRGKPTQPPNQNLRHHKLRVSHNGLLSARSALSPERATHHATNRPMLAGPQPGPACAAAIYHAHDAHPLCARTSLNALLAPASAEAH